LRQAAPGTRVSVTRFDAGTHFYDWPEDPTFRTLTARNHVV
jgi:hypothetical protein